MARLPALYYIVYEAGSNAELAPYPAGASCYCSFNLSDIPPNTAQSTIAGCRAVAMAAGGVIGDMVVTLIYIYLLPV